MVVATRTLWLSGADAMNVEHCVGQLDAPTRNTRCAAADALVDAGSMAVPALLRALRDTDSLSTVDACTRVLRSLGPLIYPPLIELLAGIRTEPGSIEAKSRAEYRTCRVLGLPALNRAAFYAGQARSANVAAREQVAEDIGRYRATDYAFVLVALLGDSDERVRRAAVKSFGELGEQVVPLLQRVRRSRLPERRGALSALAEIGWHTIKVDDLTLLRRLIMGRLAHETPRLPATTECLWWALPTDDRGAVLDAFGLSDPVPATAPMGNAVAIENRRHPIEECERVYVTPCLNGWTLVFGDPTSHYSSDDRRIRAALDSDIWKTLVVNDSDAIKQTWLASMSRPSREERCAELSRRFGAAHWYKEADDYEWGGWCIAEKGDTIRTAHLDDGVHEQLWLYGDPHPSEEGLRAEPVSQWLRDNGFSPDAWNDITFNAPSIEMWDSLWAQFQRQTGIPDAMTAARIAERASVGPLTLGPQTTVTGRALIALTERGRQSGGHRGVLPI